jgi:hypothetical protein
MANQYSQWRLGPTWAAMTAGRGSSTSCVGLSGSVCAERFPPLSESILGLRAFPVEVDHGRCAKFGTGCVAEDLDERDATHCVPPRPQRCRGVPPPGLTSEDSAAAGFKFHDQGCARCGSKAIFQLNFSPDLKHQTMFFHGPERRRTALLWMDGQPIPVPADREGNPAAETLRAVAGRTLFERLLDQCGKSRT